VNVNQGFAGIDFKIQKSEFRNAQILGIFEIIGIGISQISEKKIIFSH
jgi:hypothetical protein